MALQKPAAGLAPSENYRRFGVAFDAIDAAAGAAAAAQNAANTKAEQSSLSSLSATLSALQQTVDGKAAQSALSTLSTSTDQTFAVAFSGINSLAGTVEANFGTAFARLNNLENSVGSLTAGKAAQVDLDVLEGVIASLTTSTDTAFASVSARIGRLEASTTSGFSSTFVRLDRHDAELRTVTATASSAIVQAAEAGVLRQARPGDTPLAFTRSVSGAVVGLLLPPLDRSTLSVTPRGASALLTGQDVVARRDFFAVEAGRVYAVRFGVSRAAVSADPSNDAIVLGLTAYDRFRAQLPGAPGAISFETLADFRPSDGYHVLTTTISRASGPGIDLVLTPEQVYVKPYVRGFGTTAAVSHVEVLDIEDITDSELWSPNLTALESRVGAIESQDIGARLATVEAATGSPKTETYLSVAEAMAASIPVSVNYLSIRGMEFYRAPTGQFTSADGASWDIQPVVAAQPVGPVLTLAQGNPLPTLEYKDRSTVYVHPGRSDLVGIYNGSLWIGRRRGEGSIPLDTTNYPAATAHSVFMFVGPDGSVLDGTRAWASLVSPGTDPGTAAIELFQGRWVNRHQIELRRGSALNIVPARQALYLGAFATSAAGLTEDSFTKRFVSSVFDDRRREMKRRDPAANWVYSTAAFNIANNGNNRLQYFHCLPGRTIDVSVYDAAYTTTDVPITVACNIGLDSTSPIGDFGLGPTAVLPYRPVGMEMHWSGAPGMGLHTLNWLEYAAYDPGIHSGSAQVWLGQSGTTQCGISAKV